MSRRNSSITSISFGQFIEWFCISLVCVWVSLVAVTLMTGPTMDHNTGHNVVLVVWGIAGATAFSVWYGWFVLNRASYSGQYRDMPFLLAGGWTLATGAVLWLVASAVDDARIDPTGYANLTVVPRAEPVWQLWIPFVFVCALSIVIAPRFRLSRPAIASVPLHILLWALALYTA